MSHMNVEGVKMNGINTSVLNDVNMLSGVSNVEGMSDPNYGFSGNNTNVNTDMNVMMNSMNMNMSTMNLQGFDRPSTGSQHHGDAFAKEGVPTVPSPWRRFN